MNLSVKKIVFLIALLASPALSYDIQAAGMGMGMGPPCGGPFPPCPVPLDSGVLLLLLAGATYGGWKIYKAIKKNPA